VDSDFEADFEVDNSFIQQVPESPILTLKFDNDESICGPFGKAEEAIQVAGVKQFGRSNGFGFVKYQASLPGCV
jgi:hypothetical protein